MLWMSRDKTETVDINSCSPPSNHTAGFRSGGGDCQQCSNRRDSAHQYQYAQTCTQYVGLVFVSGAQVRVQYLCGVWEDIGNQGACCSFTMSSITTLTILWQIPFCYPFEELFPSLGIRACPLLPSPATLGLRRLHWTGKLRVR